MHQYWLLAQPFLFKNFAPSYIFADLTPSLMVISSTVILRTWKYRLRTTWAMTTGPSTSPWATEYKPVLWSWNYLFPLRHRLSKSSAPAPEPAPAITLELPVITDFTLKSTFFMFFMKENRPNSHAKSYSIWISIFIYYFSWLGAGSQSRSRNFDIPAPCSSGSTTLVQTVLLLLNPSLTTWLQLTSPPPPPMGAQA